jgi:hypothetical protein
VPRLLYIGQTPAEGTGSPVIVLRHLRRCAANRWDVQVIAERGQDTAACTAAGWPVGVLPLRRPWWPPYRASAPLLHRLRVWLLAGECLRFRNATPPDAVVAYLAAHADFMAEVAAVYARRARRRLTLLVHDDAAAFTSDPAQRRALRARHRRLLAQAPRICFVSPELAGAYGLPAGSGEVLWPLPEGWVHDRTETAAPADIDPRAASAPARVYYAGFLWPAQLPLLGQLAAALAAHGARLHVMTRRTPALEAWLATAPAIWVEPRPSNREALEWLRRDADALVVSYAQTLDELPWAATSFPSKLVEYVHLQKPLAIVAPRDSAVRRWAERTSYRDAFDPADHEGFAAWGQALRDPAARAAGSAAAAALARGEFNPVNIHRQFEVGLIAPTPARP